MRYSSGHLLILLFIFLLILPAFGEDITEDPFTGETSLGPEYIRGEILVDFKDNITLSEIENFKQKYNLNDLHLNSQYSQEEKLTIATVKEQDLNSLIDLISRDPVVEYAEPDYLYYAYSSLPNDPLYKYQWHMDQINVRNAWDINAGEDVIVAVIDTGVAYTDHDKFRRAEDLENTKFVQGYNFVNDNPYACDDNCHGTHVAGTIAQSTYNGKGVVGVAYQSKIMPLKVLSAQGFGSTGDIADAIRYAADHGAKVINMSLGGPFSSKIMADACTYAYNKGVTIICAAGNSSSTKIGYPAAYPECIAVSATRFDKDIAYYSNKGKNIDIAAPGGDLRVDQNKDGKKDGVLQNTINRMNPSLDDYYLFQGTSMASPHVAGVATMLVSMGITNPQEVEKILKASADKNVGKELDYGYGAGIVNAWNGVLHAGLLRGFIKLLLGLVLLGIFLFKLRDSSPKKQFIISPLFFIGTIIGSSGFFFLPFFGIVPPVLRQIICTGFPQWDIAILGAEAHQNPIFYSAFIPCILSIFFSGANFSRNLFIGFNIGVAGHLLYAALSNDAYIVLIPYGIDKLWLILSVLVCIYMAWNLGTIFTKDNNNKI